jgi:hypothetical protein
MEGRQPITHWSENLPLAKAFLQSGVMADRVEEAATRHVEKPESLRFWENIGPKKVRRAVPVSHDHSRNAVLRSAG